MNVTAFKLSDLAEIDVQEAQRQELTAGMLGLEVLEGHAAYTAREGSRIIAIAGVIRLDRDVGLLWALIARGAGAKFLRLHRAARRLMQVAGFARLLSLARCNFENGCRWHELLGFTKAEDEPLITSAGNYWIYARAVT